MERQIYGKLVAWKDSPRRKPLILRGVRQCGKTYILKEFGSRNYSDVVYFTFERNSTLQQVFEKDLDPHRIVKELSVIIGRKITEDTLIIFDEIQFSKTALASLKYFCDEAPEYHVVCAGSLLGVMLARDSRRDEQRSFPVGKVNILTMRPMGFREFLLANGKGMLVDHVEEEYASGALSDAMLSECLTQYLDYLCVGGMPEAVDCWVREHDMGEVERIHRDIVTSYEGDFIKHAPPSMVSKIHSIWNDIPMQLSKEARRFIFGHAVPGARSADLHEAVQWLVDAGLVHKVDVVKDIKVPLKAYSDPATYKLYYCDVGLLRTVAGLDSSSILLPDPNYREFKGSMAENFVLNELMCDSESVPFYWTSEGKAEVDFIVPVRNVNVPIEVKSEDRVRAASLKVYVDRFSPERAVIVSKKNVRLSRIGYLPLPLMWLFRDFVGLELPVEGVGNGPGGPV